MSPRMTTVAIAVGATLGVLVALKLATKIPTVGPYVDKARAFIL